MKSILDIRSLLLTGTVTLLSAGIAWANDAPLTCTTNGAANWSVTAGAARVAATTREVTAATLAIRVRSMAVSVLSGMRCGVRPAVASRGDARPGR